MKSLLKTFLILSLITGCGRLESDPQSEAKNLMGEVPGWAHEDSLYILPPGAQIGVCTGAGVKKGVDDLVINSIKLWVEAAGRDASRLKIVKACSGDRVLNLVQVPDSVEYFGKVSPLEAKRQDVFVPQKWAGHWTANHELGHLFGFAHIFDNQISIMNSEDNGSFMNGGYLSAYDRLEIKRLLSKPQFARVNKLWANEITQPVVSAPIEESDKSCLGVDGKTRYPHKKVTTYAGKIYTCANGDWISSEIAPRSPVLPVTPKSCLGANGKTLYTHETVTTYEGNTHTCRNGEWIFSPGIK